MKFTDLLTGFAHLGRDPFPTHLCVHRNAREPDVMDSGEDDYHLVVMVDARFDVHGAFAKMKPYTCINREGEGPELLYGWVDADGNLGDHGEHDIHNDHMKVVAWRPCERGLDLRTL